MTGSNPSEYSAAPAYPAAVVAEAAADAAESEADFSDADAALAELAAWLALLAAFDAAVLDADRFASILAAPSAAFSISGSSVSESGVLSFSADGLTSKMKSAVPMICVPEAIHTSHLTDPAQVAICC